ncbi:MAG: Sec-independent protein translocase protein TatB [Cardiobacteriaceae bacterium]|nr:Sec-independent protein translocase protein TatB [Cardiobacteriaceae bacterium]
MFDIGFWELAFIAIIGIVVVGPKRLPEVVRSVAIVLRKARRMFSDVKADIERELDLDDMRRIVREADMEEHIRQLNQSVIDAESDVRASGKALLRDIDDVKSKAQSMMDVYDPALADGEKDTGIEPRRDLDAIEKPPEASADNATGPDSEPPRP